MLNFSRTVRAVGGEAPRGADAAQARDAGSLD